jgi:uncharacterized integral membrane protein
MKAFTVTLIIIALALIGFNTTQIDFNSPFKGESLVALITILASLCVILMMLILIISKRIEQKVKNRN